MLYISVDIETTGLNVNTSQVLEIGAIIEDSRNPLPFDELPKFHCIINHDELKGSPFALNMNQRILEILAKRTASRNKTKFDNENNVVPDAETAVLKFANWVGEYYNTPFKGYEPPYYIIAAGKNFSVFDLKFLELLPNWNSYIKIFRRIPDPVSLFIDWNYDVTPPDLKQCKERAGIENSDVSHLALEDAWDVIQVLRTKYNSNTFKKEKETNEHISESK